MKSRSRLAVIDLGSNSFRLVVFTAAKGWWQRTDEIYQPVRIGEGMAATGKLGEEPVRRALAALDVFDHFCEAAGLENGAVDAVATSAIRDAENAPAFLARARERTKLPIRVLSREQEARYGYLAAVNSTTLTDGCVLDLGGGSMQLVRVEDRLARESGSWRVGAVRMTERFLSGPNPPKRGQLQQLREHVAAELQSAAWLAGAGRRLVGIGGTVRSLAAVAQRAEGLPGNGVQGMVVSREALAQAIERLAALPPAERANVPGVKPTRADLILAGAVVVEGALLAGGFEALEVTEAGLREGVFFERHLSKKEGRDAPAFDRLRHPPGDPDAPEKPPLFEDVRRSSVINLAARYRVDGAHTRHVAALALGMFDQLARLRLHAGDATERELLWAACMLHDIGMSVDYDDHHKHSRYLILSAGLPGFSPIEAAIVAQAARYHRKGLPDPGPLAALFDPGDAARLDRCAVLLRLAEDLERSRDQLVRDTELSSRNGSVQLRLLADGGVAVPRWAAGRESELFARAFDRQLSVVA
ncbi:MAG TPA: Ppx/GppA phosphatase family protein [Solirubrobacteraceae bacterium]|jgi:exopolyphosphatase/guanosine-5'-triphosphate,3'-diphosphate pyrophosphatase|nr:Ppx/GppA phosphatase family protein [Solirubrobacteraceae bacterium]